MRVYVKTHNGIIETPTGIIYTHVNNSHIYAVTPEGLELDSPWELSSFEDMRIAGGEFVDVKLETTEQKLERIDEQNIILMDALATTFEELIALRELMEGGTK